jgi:predicted regulator of Ras-like GTPase activity (Roadblock/LC7/MglB family)
MDDGVYSFAFKSALEEIRSVCPGITHTLVFREDGQIVVGDPNTPEANMVQVVNAFDAILKKADPIGRVECITVQGSNGRVNLFFMDDLYFLIVTSTNADMNYVNTVTHVLIPTILRLVEKIWSVPLKSDSLSTETRPKPETPVEENEKLETLTESVEKNPVEEPEKSVEPEIEPLSPELPPSQLIVENLGGLLVKSDTVRIDSAMLSQWEAFYKGKKIEKVEIETFDGKKTMCKVKPIKDSKCDGESKVQMPEKIQSTLEIKKGELVRAKPIVE